MPKKSAKKKTTNKASKVANDEPKVTKVVTGKVTAAFAHLIEPDRGQSGKDDPKWQVTAIIPADDKKTIKDIKEAVANAKAIGEEKGKVVGKQSKNGNPIKDAGDIFDLEKYPEYEGAIAVKFSTNQGAPTVLSKSKRVLDSDEDVYSGMLCAISGAAYAWNNGGWGISFILGAVMKLEDGERIGGGGGFGDIDGDFGDFIEEDEDGFDEEDEDEDDDETEEDDDEGEDEDEEVTIDDIKKAAKKLKEQKGGKKALKAILEDYDVEKLSELDEDDFEDVLEEIEEEID